MSTSIIPFTYSGQDVRTVAVDGEPWFVLADLCAVLDIANPRNVASRLADDMKGVRPVDTLGGVQQMTVVSEAGMYAVVMRSDKPQSEPFRRWVTAEVLPAIRRTGGYGAAPAMSPEELMARALLQANATIEAARPKIAVADRLLDATTDYSVQDAANALTRAGFKLGRQRLFALLQEISWIYRGSDKAWRPYSRVITAGRLSVMPSSHYHPRTGELVLDPPQVRVTPKGLQHLLLAYGPAQASLDVAVSA